MPIKHALTFLAADIRKVAIGSGGFIAVGTFFGGTYWNVPVGMLVFALLEGVAFYVQVMADRQP